MTNTDSVAVYPADDSFARATALVQHCLLPLVEGRDRTIALKVTSALAGCLMEEGYLPEDIATALIMHGTALWGAANDRDEDAAALLLAYLAMRDGEVS